MPYVYLIEDEKNKVFYPHSYYNMTKDSVVKDIRDAYQIPTEDFIEKSIINKFNHIEEMEYFIKNFKVFKYQYETKYSYYWIGKFSSHSNRTALKPSTYKYENTDFKKIKEIITIEKIWKRYQVCKKLENL